jgi:hypothetical protein
VSAFREVLAALAVLACGCSFKLDEALQRDPSLPQRILPDSAPSLRYELLVIAPADQTSLRRTEPFGTRVGWAVDDLLQDRGVRPSRLDGGAHEGAWMRLTLIHGRKQVDLRVEQWSGDRLLRERSYATKAQGPRQDVGDLLDRFLHDFKLAPREPAG